MMAAGTGSSAYSLPPPEPNGRSINVINVIDLMPTIPTLPSAQAHVTWQTQLIQAGIMTLNEARTHLTMPDFPLP